MPAFVLLIFDVIHETVCVDDLLHELGEGLSFEGLTRRYVGYRTRIKVYRNFIAVRYRLCGFGAFHDGKADVN